MSLFWNDTEILPGMLLEVEEFNSELSLLDDTAVQVRWKILELKSKGKNEAFYEPGTGKSYSIRKVMKSRSLLRRQAAGKILQIPACTDYLVVQEYHDGKIAGMRCYSLDMLDQIRRVKIVAEK